MGIVRVDATDPSDVAPDTMSIRLNDPDGLAVRFVNGAYEIFYSGGAGTSTLAAQFDATAIPTSAGLYTVAVRSWWSDGAMKEDTASVRIFIVNEQSSPFGAGWSLAGLQKLHFQSDSTIVVTEGNGSLALFEPMPWACDSMGCPYSSGRGDFSKFKLVQDRFEGQILREWYERHYPDGSYLEFNTAGQLTFAYDRFGNRTTYLYDAAGRIEIVRDPAGKEITFGYAGDGKIDWISDPGGRTTYVDIDTAGNVTQIRDPAGGYAFRATYDAYHRLKHRTDRAGNSSGFAYDHASKILEDTMPTIQVGGSSVRPVIRYRASERSVLVDPGSGLGISANPAPRVLPQDVTASITDAKGNETTLVLNRFGAPTRIEEPLGRVTQIFRNWGSQDTLIISPSGHQVKLQWFGPKLGKIYDVTTTQTINFAYEINSNNPSQVFGDTDSIWNYWSDGKLDSVRVGRSTQPVTKFYHDWFGRDTLVVDPAGHTTRYYYASAGFMNLDSIRDGSRITSFRYDALGRDTLIKNASGEVTRVNYDELNRVWRTIGPRGDITTSYYGALYLDSIQDAVSQRYRFVTNALGWVTRRTDPAGVAESFEYDRNGNVTRYVNRRGGSVTYTYDALNQLTSQVADGKTTTYHTDPGGAYVTASNSESTDTLRFDIVGRPEFDISWRPDLATRYVLRSSYNTRGLRSMLRITSPWADTIRYEYDAYMQLESLIGLAGGTTQIGYNYDRQATSFALTGGISAFRSYPSTHKAGEVTYSADFLNSKLGIKFHYDRLKRVDDRHNVVGDSVSKYGYDELGNLNLVQKYHYGEPDCEHEELELDSGEYCIPGTETLLSEENFTYDKVGNRTDSGARLAAGNRLIAFAADSLVYDLDGNLTHRYDRNSDLLKQRLYWSTLGQLDSVWTSGSGTVRYGYNGFGRRVRKTTDSGTTHYLYDGDDLFAELDGNGNIVSEYTYYPGVDVPHSVRRNGTVYYYATDFPGNVMGLFTGTGTLVNRYRYAPFGADSSVIEGVANALRFAALPLDTVPGLYYVRNRYYDPILARFVSEDPIGLGAGINPYLYAGNSPMTYRDPSGLCPEEDDADEEDLWACITGYGPLVVTGRRSTLALNAWWSVNFGNWQPNLFALRGPGGGGGGGGGGGPAATRSAGREGTPDNTCQIDLIQAGNKALWTFATVGVGTLAKGVIRYARNPSVATSATGLSSAGTNLAFNAAAAPPALALGLAFGASGGTSFGFGGNVWAQRVWSVAKVIPYAGIALELAEAGRSCLGLW